MTILCLYALLFLVTTLAAEKVRALAFGIEPISEGRRLCIAERRNELSQRTQLRAGTAWKGYNKPKLTRHAELKSVTFSRGFDAYDYEGDDGGSEG